MPGENKIYYEGVIRDLHAALRLHFFKTESGCFCVTCTSFRLLPLARLHHQLHFLLKWFHFVFYACNIRRYWRQDAKHGSSQFSVVDLVVTNNWAPFLFFLVLTALRIHLRSTDRALDITTILVFWGVAEGTQKKKKTGELRAGKRKKKKEDKWIKSWAYGVLWLVQILHVLHTQSFDVLPLFFLWLLIPDLCHFRHSVPTSLSQRFTQLSERNSVSGLIFDFA